MSPLRILTAGALFSLVVLGVLAGEKGPATFDDTAFLKNAISGGMHEVRLGKLAILRAKHVAVKEFGERMVKDHSEANEDLKALARSLKVVPPEKTMREHQEEYKRLAKFTGRDFDMAYIKHMVADHEIDVKEFTRASKEANSPELRKLATKLLPKLRDHLKMARETKARLDDSR